MRDLDDLLDLAPSGASCVVIGKIRQDLLKARPGRAFKQTPWRPAGNYHGYEERLNENGHLETRPIQQLPRQSTMPLNPPRESPERSEGAKLGPSQKDSEKFEEEREKKFEELAAKIGTKFQENIDRIAEAAYKEDLLNPSIQHIYLTWAKPFMEARHYLQRLGIPECTLAGWKIDFAKEGGAGDKHDTRPDLTPEYKLGYRAGVTDALSGLVSLSLPLQSTIANKKYGQAPVTTQPQHINPHAAQDEPYQVDPLRWN